MINTSLFDGKRKEKTEQILQSLNINVLSGSAAEQLPVIIANNLAGQPALIVSDDKNDGVYLRSLKEAFVSAGLSVSVCVFSTEKEETAVARLISCGENFRCIIAVGGEDVINVCRFYSGLKNKYIFAVPNTVDVQGIIPPYVTFTANGLPENVKSKTIDTLFLDKSAYYRCKKHDLANAFSSSVSKCLTLVDYKYACAAEGKELSPTAYNYFVEAINDALNIPSSSCVYDWLLKSQLKISIAKSISDIDEYSACGDVAKILLATDKTVSKQEAEFVAFVRLVKLYRAYIDDLDFILLNTPDFCSRINEVASFMGVRVSDMLAEVKCSLSVDEKRGKEAVKLLKPKLIKELDGVIALLGKIKDFKVKLCNPKKPMNKFSALQIKKGIALGAYTGKKPTILKLMNLSGFCQLLD